MVGLRPTLGLVSRTGVIPVSKSMDTPGAIGRTVRDVAIMLGAITGVDPKDEVTLKSEGKIIHDYRPYLRKNGLKGKRIGIDESMLTSSQGVGALLQQAIKTMEEQGAILVKVSFISKYNTLVKAESDLLKFEFKSGIH